MAASKTANKIAKFNILLVNGHELQKFLHSCAATEVLFRDSEIMTESTGLLWFGAGDYLPGGTAKRVTQRLTDNQRRIIAVRRTAQLMQKFNALMNSPAEQIRFLITLSATRDKQRASIQSLFDEAHGHNATADAWLKAYANAASDLQSVAVVSLAVLATGGAIATGGGVVLAGATAGKMFAITLGTKSIIAFAQSEHDLNSLAGFAVGTVKDGIITLGELSAKAFEVVKDRSIQKSLTNMARATTDYLTTMQNGYARIGELQKELDSIKLASSKSNERGLMKAMVTRAAEIEEEMADVRAAMAKAGRGAVGVSKTGKFMKDFGGKAVPIVCLLVDVVNEKLRNQEVRDTLEKGGYR
jgi:hypothetical protein